MCTDGALTEKIDLSDEKVFPGGVRFKALFSPDVKWRLIQ